MVGPEDSESLAKVKAVSRVFNATHVLPFFHSVAKESEEDTVFFVSIERLKEQAQVSNSYVLDALRIRGAQYSWLDTSSSY